MKKADIGVIGLAVMGENLAMNMESKGFTVAVYNRTAEKVDAFLNGRAAGKNFIGAHTPEELVASLCKPRKIFMMVKAGKAVDALIETLLPLLVAGWCLAGKADFLEVRAKLRSLRAIIAGKGRTGVRMRRNLWEHMDCIGKAGASTSGYVRHLEERDTWHIAWNIYSVLRCLRRLPVPGPVSF